MKLFSLASLVVCLMVGHFAVAASSYDSLPAAKKGGNFNDVLGITPITMNPLLTTDVESQDLAGQFYLSLFGVDGDTYEFYPVLATKVEVSKDKKDYTYTLNEKAKFTNGLPLTTDDVEYTFARIMDPKVQAAPLRGFYEEVTFKKLDDHRFTFHVEHPKFNTLEVLNGFTPLEKKQFEAEPDFNKSRENLHPIGTSCFTVKSFSRDQLVVLECDLNWWGSTLPQFKARFNFATVTYKIIQDATLRYEKLLKNELDSTTLTSDQYVTQVHGVDQDRFGKSPKDGKAVWADKLKSDGPMSWFGLALNLTNPIFKSLATRKGIAYLIDYDGITQKAFYGTMEQSVSPFGSNTNNTDPSLKLEKNRYHFDIAKAADYFKKDGWTHEAGDAFLSKVIDGKKTMFRFVLKYPPSSPAQGKAAQMLKEIFKKSGVDLDIKPTDGTALYKEFDEKNFEAIFMAWGGGGIYPDPKQLWSTDSINGGSNKVSFTNPKVDELIKKANLEFDRKKRAKSLQEIGKIIYEELPYVFIGERHFVLQAMNSRIKSPKWIEKYGTSVAKDLFHE